MWHKGQMTPSRIMEYDSWHCAPFHHRFTTKTPDNLPPDKRFAQNRFTFHRVIQRP